MIGGERVPTMLPWRSPTGWRSPAALASRRALRWRRAVKSTDESHQERPGQIPAAAGFKSKSLPHAHHKLSQRRRQRTLFCFAHAPRERSKIPL